MFPEPDELIGREFGGYNLVRVLGRGATGVVYLGERNGSEHTKAAIKILFLPPQLTVQEVAEFRARFRREVQTLLELHHPHILSVLGFGEDAGTGLSYLVLPYVPDTLAQRMTKAGGLLPFTDIVLYVTQLADALDYAHRHGVIHRDVKPANVLLDEEGNIFLADFSIAYLFDLTRTALTSTGRVLGTPNYMAPEQVKGHRVGPATDIYSLGVLLYQLVTGRVPFEGNSLYELIQRVSTETPVSPRQIRPDLPEPANAAILRALAKQPAYRFPTSQALAQAFVSGLQGRWAQGLVPYSTAEATVYDPTEANTAPSGPRAVPSWHHHPPHHRKGPILSGPNRRLALLLSALGAALIILVVGGLLALSSMMPGWLAQGSPQLPFMATLTHTSTPTDTPVPTPTDTPTPVDTPTPTSVPNYSALVPGPGCGSADWTIDSGLKSRVQCTSPGLFMTYPANASTFTEVDWGGAGSPTSYAARVTVSGLSSACAGIGFQSGYRGYIGYVCSDGVWYVMQYDSTGAPSQQGTGSVPQQSSQLIEIIVTSSSFAFHVGATTVFTGPIANGYDTSDVALALMGHYSGQAGQAYFSDFVYGQN